MRRAARIQITNHARGKHSSSAAIGGYAEAKTSKRRVDRKAVACPDCPAEVGEPCLNKDGGDLHTVHAARKRLTTRLDNQQREQEGTLVALPYPERKPGTLETDDETVPVCDFCGLRIVRKGDNRASHNSRGNQFNGSGSNNVRCPGSGEYIA